MLMKASITHSGASHVQLPVGIELVSESRDRKNAPPEHFIASGNLYQQGPSIYTLYYRHKTDIIQSKCI